jgi:competence protein ComEA
MFKKVTMFLVLVMVLGLVSSFATEEKAAAKINVNTATIEALDTLPGIGPVIASRIVEARKEGKFTNLEDFQKRVKGIGEKKAAILKDLITF